MANLDGADRLGHVEHAHRRRRYRPGAGADRREAGLGPGLASGDRLRDHSVGDDEPATGRRDLRISGFFRDAFPDQIALFDRAVRAVAALDEDEADNPLAARARAESAAG
jgi:hypothetical protein